MQIMYDCIYKELVEAGVASVLKTPVWMDIEGNIVDSEEKAFGDKVAIESSIQTISSWATKLGPTLT
jgi:hypothetical protein